MATMNKFKLRKRDKAKWVKALRSGQYAQGTETLKRISKETSYCCLGVACQLGICRPASDDGSIKEFIEDADFVDTEFLPMKIQEKLADFNDQGKSFKWIASYIERYL